MEFAEESATPNNTVIPNQCAHWCGNLHRISGCLSSYIPLFCTVFWNSSTRSGASIRGIATPVCGLVRNDREFDKFQFIRLLRKSNSPNTHYIVYKLDMYNSQHFHEFFVMRTGETGANCHENQTPLIPGRIGARGRLRIRENHGSRENRCHRSVYSSRLIFRNRSGRQPPWTQTSRTSSGWNRPSPDRNDREFGKAAASYFFAFYIIKETHPRVKRSL